MLIVCAGFGLLLINVLDTPMLIILSGAPAYFINMFIRYCFVLSLRGPLIKESPLGGCAECRVWGRVLAGAEGNGARPRAGRAVFCVRM